MNRDTLEENWQQVRGEAKTKWSRLTEDDLQQVDGEYDRFVGRLQERYGMEEEKARRQVEEWNLEEEGEEESGSSTYPG